MLIVLLGLLGIGVYFLPTIIVCIRAGGTEDAGELFIWNLFFGWTVIWWIIALVMSFTIN